MPSLLQLDLCCKATCVLPFPGFPPAPLPSPPLTYVLTPTPLPSTSLVLEPRLFAQPACARACSRSRWHTPESPPRPRIHPSTARPAPWHLPRPSGARRPALENPAPRCPLATPLVPAWQPPCYLPRPLGARPLPPEAPPPGALPPSRHHVLAEGRRQGPSREDVLADSSGRR